MYCHNFLLFVHHRFNNLVLLVLGTYFYVRFLGPEMGPDTERILTDRQDNNIGERKITGPTAKLCVASVRS